MKVLLLKDVAKVGKRGSVKEITDGYALNYLLPQGLARQATTEVIAAASKCQEAERRSQSEMREKAQKALKLLDGQKIMIKANANAQGHLFKGVRVEDVAAAVLDSTNVVLEPNMIALGASAIKDTGQYSIRIAGEGIDAAVTLIVEAAGSAS